MKPAYLAQHYSDLSFEAHPRACALRCPREGPLTYEDLYHRSNQLAHSLRAAGVRRQSRVALCLERGATSIIAMLAALKADAIYVPIDERSSSERCRGILADCQPASIVVDRQTVDRVLDARPPGCAAAPLVVLGVPGAGSKGANGGWITQDQVDVQSDRPLPYCNVDTDVAYVLYTSGSTGRPKGVMISHLNIVNYVEWAVDYFGIGQDERILSTAPFHFDMSTFDIYCAQKAGATLCLAGEEHTRFPIRLVELIEQERVTLWKGVASLLAYMARTGAVQPGRLGTLTRVLFSGERLPTRVLIAWMRAFPEKRFYNVYGPTEATGISTAYAVPALPESADEDIPIGRACANTEVLVTTEDGRIAGPGEVGEICIRGSSLSRGYWNDEEKTRVAFVENCVSAIPGDRLYRTGDLGHWGPDGQLRLVGRRDEQVKWMGYRIELGEIVSSIQAVPDVEDAAVLLLPSRTGETEELVAFVVLGRGVEGAAVLRALRQKLPAYMIPKQILEVDALPRSDRGKVDRDALKRIHQQGRC